MTIKPTQSVARTLLFAKIESAKGVDANPSKLTDAFLIGNADIQLDPTVLERDLYSSSFSPNPGQVGRKVVNVTFDHEVKGSGANGQRPKIGTLLRACGFQETTIAVGAATQIDTPVAFGSVNGVIPTWAKTAPPTQRYGSYLVNVVTGGASGAAKVQVTKHEQGDYDATLGNNLRYDVRTNYTATSTLAMSLADPSAPTITVGGTVTTGNVLYAVVMGEVFRLVVTSAMTTTALIATALAALIDADPRFTATAVASVITIGFALGAVVTTLTSGSTAIPLGDSGASITPTWSGNLTVGQQFVVVLHEAGYLYKPLSDTTLLESLTIYFYKDGNLHIVTGCQGTVTFNGESGGYANASFEFTGGFLAPVPEPLPTGAVYEQSQPPQVELAQMSIRGDKDFCAQSFTITVANDINPRDCLNGAEGLNGSNITGRTPTASLNPESSIDVYDDMWGAFARGETVPLHLRVGSVKNNQVRFFMPRASYTGLNYGDRNGTATKEPAFQLNRLSADGDDELRIYFPQAA